MERIIAESIVKNEQGSWRVSTIRTDAGGANPVQRLGSPFSSSDYTDETPWPFETIVFGEIGMTGHYHEPYNTKKEAKQGHSRIVQALTNNTLEMGKGVYGPFGVPSLTAEQWHSQQSK